MRFYVAVKHTRARAYIVRNKDYWPNERKSKYSKMNWSSIFSDLLLRFFIISNISKSDVIRTLCLLITAI